MSKNTTPDLILYNARVVTLNPKQPIAEFVSIKDGKILNIGSSGGLNKFRLPNIRSLNCHGHTIIPGFIDAHMHIFGYASSLVSVDCTPKSIGSISQIKIAIKKKLDKIDQWQWIRGTGYNEFYLEEGRHPNRWDLDNVAPNHPIKLNHRSGHACVLNSAALREINITKDTPDPPNGVIDRNWDTGEPTGLLFEMEGHIEQLIPKISKAEMLNGITLANKSLVSNGITSIQDATISNKLEDWSRFKNIRDDGLFFPRITMMVGASNVADFNNRKLKFGSKNGDVTLGHAKIIINQTTGASKPSIEELRQIVELANQSKFPLALHAIETISIEEAIRVINSYPNNTENFRHRVEHCFEPTSSLISTMKALGIVVVTQPSFIYYNGERYLKQIAPPKQNRLYPLKSLFRSGILVASGSDAPVAPINPIIGLYSAVTRRTETGAILGQLEALSPFEALQMHTKNGAYVGMEEKIKGSIEPGKLADLVLLDHNPTTIPIENLKEIQVLMTIIGGKIVFEK